MTDGRAPETNTRVVVTVVLPTGALVVLSASPGEGTIRLAIVPASGFHATDGREVPGAVGDSAPVEGEEAASEVEPCC